MSLSEHKISATVIPLPTIIPPYSVDRPAVLVFSEPYAASTSDKFSYTANEGFSYGKASPGHDSPLANRFNSSGTATNTVVGLATVTGLSVGQTYTFRAWNKFPGAIAGEGQSIGVVGIGVTPTYTATDWTERKITFQATASSHQLRIATVTKSETFAYWDDLTLTRDAYTENFLQQTIPATPIPLDVKESTITLDATYQPYIRAELLCWAPSDITKIEQIDPRVTGIRVTVHTEANYLGTRPATVRDYDLILRARSVDPDAGTMTLTLASEEALLQDKRLVSQTSERVYGLSVKRAVDLAMSKIGKTVAAGFTDADIVTDPIPAPITNKVQNPSFEVNTTAWTAVACTLARTSAWAASGGFSASLTAPTAGDSYLAPTAAVTTTAGSLFEAGKTYTVAATIRIPAVITGAVGARPRSIAVFTMRNMVYTETSSGSAPNAVGSYRLSVTFTVPTDATEAFVRFYLGHTGTATVLWDAISITEGTAVPEYFDGSTSVALRYTDTWAGGAHNSQSTRTFLPNADAMIWRPGVTASDYLEPLLNSTGLRLYADESRVWRLLPQNTLTEGQVNVSPLNGLTRTSDDIDRDADGWYDSVVVRYFWNDTDGKEQEAYDIAGAPGTKTLFVEVNTRIPKFGAAQAHLAAALGKGRTYEMEAISDYWALPGKQVVLSVPGQISATGIIRFVSFRFPEGEMSIGTRSSVETPLTAWLLAPTGRRWQDVATGTSWNTYTQ